MKEKKLALEVYGLLRMSVGVAQFVGLLFAFYMLDFIIKYPSGALLFVLDEDFVALMSLAVLFRSIFHIVSGIGIASMQKWVRPWLFFGWLFILIIHFGLAFSLFESWKEQGYVSHFLEVFSLVKLFAFLGLIVFDVTFVQSVIGQYHQTSDLTDEMKPLGGRRIGFSFAVVVICFVVLLFFGRQLNGGFHKGFYKSSDTKVLKPKRMSESSQKVSTKLSIEGLNRSEIERRQESPTAMEVVQQQKKTVKTKGLEPRKSNLPTELAYLKMIGWLGGICLIFGFLFQIFEINNDEMQGRGVRSAGFFIVAFCFWIIYGLGLKSSILVASCVGCLLLSSIILILNLKK